MKKTFIRFEKQCTRCAHIIAPQFNPFLADGIMICEAFMNGIPKELWSGEVSHDKPYSGDRGIQYKEVE